MATNSSNGTTTKSPPMPSPLRNSKFLQRLTANHHQV
ncbi:BnaA04g16640D [Brassica napus]|uniref:BnaA04g16640D protein n=1 Tax=Brassica napus TaxID=3708 RepID=A0A078H4H8_BRANA|nr:BnaA04g16640D [Brassica napus]